MERLYHHLIRTHFQKHRQMLFLAGPRQVGKTTTGMLIGEESKKFFYFNWDSSVAREKLLAGEATIAEEAGLLAAGKIKPVLVFDEIHKYRRWKQFLKGFFDLYGERCHILVTGSAKLNIYKRIGDSLMGRYFLYRIHPLSVAEILRVKPGKKEIQSPKKIDPKEFKQLFDFGGFPEPFLKSNRRFSSSWKQLRREQLVQEDIRDLSQIQELGQLDMLAHVLSEHVGKQVSQSSLAKQIQVSVPTIKRWLKTLEDFYYCFHVSPWFKNVTRSLRKEPKYFLWDWTAATNPGAQAENFVAAHLLKAVHFWTDYGFGQFGLHYVRDKEKREVDFLVTKDSDPWFLVEVKKGSHSGISKSLYHFQKQTGATHAFQVSFDLEYEDVNCFMYKKPVIVPASTFLSQLI